MKKSNQLQLVVCVGAGKAGTSTLYAHMARYPAVSVTKYKETQFFFDDKLWQKGAQWYMENCFARNAHAKILFEADPRYMLHEKCIDRLYEAFPSAKVIVMLRNPVELAFSLYLYRTSYGRHKESFEELCETEHLRIASGRESDIAEYGFLTRGRYSGQINHILKRFPRDQIYFMIFEKFIKSQEAELKKLFDWIGIDDSVSSGDVWENESGAPRFRWLAVLMYHPSYRQVRRLIRWLAPSVTLRSRISTLIGKLNTRRWHLQRSRPKLNAHTRAKLMADFEEDIRRTEALTGLDLSVWR